MWAKQMHEETAPDSALGMVRRIKRGAISFEIAKPKNEFISRGWDTYENGTYEAWAVESIDTNILPDTVFLDIGAFHGFLSLHVAHRVNRVVAFEADSTIVPILRANFDANPHWTHLEIVEVFVAGSDGTQTISSLHSGTTGIVDLGGESWSVKKVNFGQFLESIPASSPLMIKMDIEGAEYEVLRACGDCLARRSHTSLLLELQPHLIAQSVRGNTISKKIRRRARMIRMHRQVRRKLSSFQEISNCHGKLESLSTLEREILKTGSLLPDHRMLLLRND